MTNINLYYGYIPHSTLDANKHPDEQVADLIKLLEDSKDLSSIDIYSNSPYIMFRITLLFGYSNKNIPVDKRLHGDISITNRHFEILKDGTIVEGDYYKGMISDDCLLNNRLAESNDLYSDLLELEDALQQSAPESDYRIQKVLKSKSV